MLYWVFPHKSVTAPVVPALAYSRYKEPHVSLDMDVVDRMPQGVTQFPLVGSVVITTTFLDSH